MSARIPKPGEVFRCEDGGEAVVVEPGTSAVDGLLTLLEESYGCPRFAPDNPAILAALPSVKVGTWYSCSKAWQESHWVEDGYTDYWAEDGDGKRTVVVAHFDGNAYDLGDAAADAESDGAA